MGRKSTLLAAVAACVLLSSCGGDGSSPPPTGGGGGGGGGTPTPPPPPPPPPPVTYTKFADLAGAQTFKTSCSGFEVNLGNTLPVQAGRFGDAATIQSERSAPTYDIASNFIFSQGSFNLAFTQADRGTSTSTESYSKANGNGFTERFVTFAPTFNGTPLEYARFGQIVGQLPSGFASLFCVYGVPTQLTDIPTSAVSFTNTLFLGTISVRENFGNGPASSYAISSSTSSLSANPANGAITLSIALKGRLISGGVVSNDVTDLGTFSGSTAIDGSQQSFSDILVDGSNTVAGSFGGWFFGPQGKELGYTFSIVQRRADNSDLQVSGVVMSTR